MTQKFGWRDLKFFFKNQNIINAVKSFNKKFSAIFQQIKKDGRYNHSLPVIRKRLRARDLDNRILPENSAGLKIASRSGLVRLR